MGSSPLLRVSAVFFGAALVCLAVFACIAVAQPLSLVARRKRSPWAGPFVVLGPSGVATSSDPVVTQIGPVPPPF